MVSSPFFLDFLSGAQASCLNPILLAKAKAWAVAAGGSFPCRTLSGGTRFVRAADLEAEGNGLPVRWARVKSLHRTMEKLVRVYGQACSLSVCLSVCLSESVCLCVCVSVCLSLSLYHSVSVSSPTL